MLSGHLARAKCCNKAVAASFVMRVVLGAAAVDVAAAADGVGVVLIDSLPSQSSEKTCYISDASKIEAVRKIHSPIFSHREKGHCDA